MAKQNTSTSNTLKPRKQAVTAEEKEQKNMERILRNRRAAHKSRERKRFYLKLYEQTSEKYELLFDMLIKHNVLDSNEELNNNDLFLSLRKDIDDLKLEKKLFEKENGTVNSSVPKLDDEPSPKKRKLSYDSTSPLTKNPIEVHSPESSTTTLKDNKTEDDFSSYNTFSNVDLDFDTNLDLGLELGIDLDENLLDKFNSGAYLSFGENEPLDMQQRYPAVITSK
ncbi:uncharacterized protein HGUI_00133 [Hanseniaspora guilliermondii]|uniref:BZIP domain-containing protein n=1 Tax=Hanseniaspora guilliermondii TaxID=56406 RepID=A0A1L0CGS3_9ASCO|nr:uncharacterized protein HGUI_00133 [Hanseniaspora guilliermondii]